MSVHGYEEKALVYQIAAKTLLAIPTVLTNLSLWPSL